MRTTKLLTGLVMLVALTVMVPADGESRPATPAEQEFVFRILTTFQQALPTGPAGWDETRRTEVKRPERVTVGVEDSGPMMVDYGIGWLDQVKKEAFGARVAEIGANLKPVAQQPENIKLQQKYEALATALGRAIEKGDMAEAQRIQKEMESVGQQLGAVYEAEGRQIEDAIAAAEPHDIKADVVLWANMNYVDLTDETTEEPAIAGGRVLRVHSEGRINNTWQEGVTYVLFGSWRRVDNEGNPYWEAVPPADNAHLKVRTLLVRVQAEEARARQILQGMNWTALKGLLAR